MVNLKPVLEKVQTVGNAIGPYVLGNIGAAAALHAGVERADELWDLSQIVQNTFFYSGLAAFHAGVLVPTARNGAVNYVRSLFERYETEGVTLRPHGKSALLVGALAFGLANDSIRNSSTAALEKITDDVATVLHYERNSTPPPEPPQPPQPPQPGDVGDQKLEDALQAQHDRWRVTPHPEVSGQMYSRPRGLEDWAICATDLTTGEALVDFNCDRVQMVASSNKIPIMIAYFHEVEAGKLPFDQEKTLEAMINRSSNPSTNRILRLIGGGDKDLGAERATEIIHSYGFPQTVIESIPASGRTLKNVSTAGEMNDMVTRIYSPNLDTTQGHTLPYAATMKQILGMPSAKGHRDRLADGTCIPTESLYLEEAVGAYVDIFDKTGTTYAVSVDAAVLEAHFKTASGEVIDFPYALTIAVQDRTAKEDRVLRNKGETEARGYTRWSVTKAEQTRDDSEIIFWRLFQEHTGRSYACRAHDGRHPQ